MEVGNIPKFEQFSNFTVDKVQKISQTDPSFLLKNGAEEIQGTQTPLEIERSKNIQSQLSPSDYFGKLTEVNLYNLNFGFNESSHDFFIRVSRGAFVDNKYPTDEMIRMKIYLNNMKEGVA